MKPQNNLLERSLFFSQFKSDFYYAQQYAIANQQMLFFSFLPSEFTYYIKNQDGTFQIKRQFEENIIIREGTLSLFFRVNPNGNVSKFGSIYIQIGKETYRLIIHIGKGRFYVVKE